MLRHPIRWLKETSNTPQHLNRSYLFLRKCVGVIGVALPPVLIIGTMILELRPQILGSISAYYYSDYSVGNIDYSVMGNILVGSLCAIGIFLICYRYEHLDDFVSTIAGACAIGVALFPAAPEKGATPQQMMIEHLHTVSAAGFFVTLAIFALWIFRKSDQKNPEDRTPEKRLRNKVYFGCGIAIVACIVLIGIINVLNLQSNPWLKSIHPLLVLESLAVWAFGIAWFVKGETLGILKDKDKKGEVLPSKNRETIPAR